MADADWYETRRRRKKKEPGEVHPATERVRRAAARAVGRNCRELTQMLLGKALKGDLASAKMLLELAEQMKSKKKKGPSAVERLLLEPVWEEPPESDDAPGTGCSAPFNAWKDPMDDSPGNR